MNEDEGLDHAMQTQEAADLINKALANHSNGARFFGSALYLTQWLYYNTAADDWEDQIEAFGNVVRNLLAVQKKTDTNLN